MRSSIILTAALAIGVLAGPIRRRQDYVYTVVDWVDVTVTEYVTEDPGAPATSSEVAAAAVTPLSSDDSYAGYGQPNSWSWAIPQSATPSPAPVSSFVPVVSPVVQSSAAPVSTPAPISSAAAYSSQAPATTSAASNAAGPAHVTGEAQADITSGQDYQDLVLFHHNMHRVNHSAPQLTWNQTLADEAMNLASNCIFKHDNVGQNLAASAPNANVSAQITDSWYNNEIMNYDPYYNMDSPSGDLDLYGHATQVIWKGSLTVGCATVDCRSEALGMWMTVCNYYPPGNVAPLWGENLQPGNGDVVGSWLD
ncbi:PR-1-like protein [Lepidopterella palustris CBS 459.81]|uniref:PR-1-like protein n=1 Tax=Lepidopterella palustris CBS 459.81 TaxID=1314670 RepID=A0A8E2JJ85_9PEZI|nr:PR-1-like protein [Lepidopterella palustris CBS 459.81]